ncbi:MAG: hypothetical protein AAF772_10950 [Acidobacteriota bacterium]
MTRKAEPYVGLFGVYGGDWRTFAARRLDAAGVAYAIPDDDRWQEINHQNGDEKQPLINELVAAQQRMLTEARCVVFYLAQHPRRFLADDRPVDPSYTFEALAARCELGVVAGGGVPAFAFIEPDLRGRNYLWALIAQHPHVHRCASLDEALDRAVAHMTDGA